jgi:hypothetical protein
MNPDATRRLTWYLATRHSFASQWVAAGGSMEKLAEILGRSSAKETVEEVSGR